jgi:two-component system, chemotaxis family, sensor kinase Cph1
MNDTARVKMGTVSAQKYQALKSEYENFAYIVSHDLKAPVRHIREFSRLLVDSLNVEDGSEEAELVKYVVQGSEKLGILMDELVFFSRLSSDEEEFAALTPSEILQSAVQQLENESLLSISAVEFDEIPVFSGVETQIQYLFKEVLCNAARNFTDDKQLQISISAKELDNAVEITVSDNGRGMPMDRIELAFQMFRKLHQDRNSEAPGAGLAHCKKIMSNHSGEIRIESDTDQGCKVHLSFPRSPDAT